MREIDRPDVAESAELVELRVAADRDTVVLAVVGDVCLISVPVVEAAADAAIGSGARRLVLDLSEVSVLSAAGITLLSRLVRRMHDRDGAVSVRHPRPLARRVLEITGFDHIIESEQRVHSRDHDLDRFGPDLDGSHQVACRCGWWSPGHRGAATARQAFLTHRDAVSN